MAGDCTSVARGTSPGLDSFEDGLYFVVIDGRQYESIHEQVVVGDDSRVTFLRLVPLAGG